MLAVSRLECGGKLFGSPRALTLLSVAAFPYSDWSPLGRSALTRLDGPSLFRVGDVVFALGRFQTRLRGPFALQGSAFARKRTALFRVEMERGRLVHVSDLPSSGDTSYAAAVIADGKVFISYYTNDPERDYPWLLGMLLPTRIQVAVINLCDLPQ